MAVKHVYSSAVADGGNASLVQPSNWNADHSHVPFSIVLLSEGSTSQAFTTLGAGPTELTAPKTRTMADLTTAVQARVVAAQAAAGTAGEWVRVQYSTDSGATWNFLDGTAGGGSGPSAAISATGTTLIVSAYVNLHANAKADVMLRPVGGGGAGASSPAFWRIEVQVK